MRPTGPSVALVALAVVLAVGGSVAPAHATSQPVQLSNDGRTWAPDLTRPLFDPAVRWVPGDVRRASFWVRDDGPSAGALAITADVDDGDRLIADHAVMLRLRAGSRRWSTVSAGRTAALGRLTEGHRTKVEIVAAFDPGSGDATMRRSLHFSLSVRLTGATPTASPSAPSEAPGAVSPAGGGHGGGILPNTGNPVTWWLCLVAALSLGAGTALVVRSKRRGTR